MDIGFLLVIILIFILVVIAFGSKRRTATKQDTCDSSIELGTRIDEISVEMLRLRVKVLELIEDVHRTRRLTEQNELSIGSLREDLAKRVTSPADAELTDNGQ